MKVDLQPGKYVVAVSGGVDSMVLLDLLRQKSGLELVVAHFDHGIRPDSSEDKRVVEKVAAEYGLPFYFETAALGRNASEATAREARYTFLHQMRNEHQADAIITAHHQDDVLETTILNLLRGTGRKGLSSLRSTDEIKRPILHVPKQTIRDYAKEHNLLWREDSTNQDESYLRNYVRHRVLPKLSETDKDRFLTILSEVAHTNEQLDNELSQLLPRAAESLQRKEVIALSHKEARELLAAWLRSNGLRDFDRTTLERLVVAAKTAAPGKRLDVFNKTVLRIGKVDLALEHIER